MELMQLEMFVAVVEEGSVRKASARVFRTPPALSTALRKLAEEVGTRILYRSQRLEYELTDAGEVLYKYAIQVLGLVKEAKSATTEIARIRAGDLRIGATQNCGLYVLPKILPAFAKQFPNIKVEIVCQDNDTLLTRLRHEQLDLALLSFYPVGDTEFADDPEIEARLILRDKLLVITSPAHPFSSKTSVRIAEIGNERIILENCSQLRERIVETFAHHQTPLRVFVENVPLEVLKQIVALGVGVALIPSICATEELARGTVKMVPIEELVEVDLPLWIARPRTKLSAAANVFAFLIGEALHQQN
jgi:DNA-binding transcriptional LysR family regulator